MPSNSSINKIETTTFIVTMKELFGKTTGKIYLSYNPSGSLIPKKIPIDLNCSIIHEVVITSEQGQSNEQDN